jgi:hypothetical protein
VRLIVCLPILVEFPRITDARSSIILRQEHLTIEPQPTPTRP